MSEFDPKQLGELAERATKGEWQSWCGKDAAGVRCDDQFVAIYANFRSVEIQESVERWKADAEFIAYAKNHASHIAARWVEMERELKALRFIRELAEESHEDCEQQANWRANPRRSGECQMCSALDALRNPPREGE